MQTQLLQMSVPHHGPAHLAASIEQHAHMLSTVVTKDSSTDTWEADWRRRPKGSRKSTKASGSKADEARCVEDEANDTCDASHHGSDGQSQHLVASER